MKSPALRLVASVALLTGGLAAGHWLIPHRAPPADPPAPGEKATASAPGSPAAAPATVKPAAWDGTVAGLIQLSKDTPGYRRTLAMLHLELQPLPAEQIGALTAAFPWRPSLLGDENNVMSALLDAWAEKDADAALRWAASLPRQRSRPARTQILQALAATDADKAIALARRITPASDRDQTLRDLAHCVVVSDPQRAFDLLQNDRSSHSSYQFSNVLQQWAEQDPAGAFAKARTLSRNQNRDNAISSVLGVWARTDPAAARAAALVLPEGRQRQNCLVSIFGSWAAADPTAAHAAALALPSEKERQAALHSAINSWASTDPAAAVQAASTLPKDQKNRNLLREVFNTWASQDPSAAAAAASAHPIPKQQRNNLLSGIASAWANSDPQAAMTWAQSLPAKDGGSSAVANVMHSFARADGPAAAALWQTLPADQRRGNLHNLVSSWAGEDPDAALRFAHSLERPQDRVSALVATVNALDFEKPEAINAVLNELPAGQMRVDAIHGIFSNQSQHDTAGAVRWLLTMPENERTAALRGDHYGWGGSEYADPAEMKTLLEATPSLAGRTHLWSSTASSMAGEDPAAALTWAQSIESPAARRQSILSVLQTWASENPAAAVAQARALNDPDMAKDALPNLFQNWANQDADAVLAWAETATGPERELALLQGTLAKADNDPVTSAAAVDAMLAAKAGEKPGTALTNAASQVASSWFRQDIGQATAWAMQLPPGGAQDAAVSTITQSWTRLDPVAASEWVQQLPAGDSRDIAAQQLSQGIQSSDPESAFVWASSIASESRREETIRHAAQAWMRQDRPAARAAIERAPISENVRAALLEELSKRE